MLQQKKLWWSQLDKGGHTCSSAEIVRAINCIFTSQQNTLPFILKWLSFRARNSQSVLFQLLTGHPLLPDFFLDEAPEELVKKMEEHGELSYFTLFSYSPNIIIFINRIFLPFTLNLAVSGACMQRVSTLICCSMFFLGGTPAFKASSAAVSSSSDPIEKTFASINAVLNEDIVKSTNGVYQFDLSGNSRSCINVRVCHSYVNVVTQAADVENVLGLLHFVSPDGEWSTSHHASATPMMHQYASASQKQRQRSMDAMVSRWKYKTLFWWMSAFKFFLFYLFEINK